MRTPSGIEVAALMVCEAGHVTAPFWQAPEMTPDTWPCPRGRETGSYGLCDKLAVRVISDDVIMAVYVLGGEHAVMDLLEADPARFTRRLAERAGQGSPAPRSRPGSRG